jgi:hypothetical protein
MCAHTRPFLRSSVQSSSANIDTSKFLRSVKWAEGTPENLPAHLLTWRLLRAVGWVSETLIQSFDRTAAAFNRIKAGNARVRANIRTYQALGPDIAKFYYNDESRAFYQHLSDLQNMPPHGSLAEFSDVELYDRVLSSRKWWWTALTYVTLAALVACMVIIAPFAFLIGIPLRLALQWFKNPLVYRHAAATAQTFNAASASASASASRRFVFLTQNLQEAEFEWMNERDDDGTTRGRRHVWWEWFTSTYMLSDLMPHVVAQQEVFDPHTAAWQATRLQSIGYNVVYAAEPVARWGGVGISSGLLLASRLPILKAAFQPYRHVCGLGKLANKGILGVILDIGDGARMCVLTTHSQAGLGDEAGSGAHRHAVDQFVNFGENDEITAFRRRLCEGFSVACTLLTGDLNKATLRRQFTQAAYAVHDDYWLLRDLEDRCGWTNLTTCAADEAALLVNESGERQVLGTSYITDMPHFQHFDLFVRFCRDRNMPRCVVARQASKLDHLLVDSTNDRKVSAPMTRLLQTGTHCLASDHAALVTSFDLDVV